MQQEPLGIVLFAHGSRDARWREPVEAVAARIQARTPQIPVRCAYLELTAPDLPEAVVQLRACGAHQIRIVPMFLGLGRHVREDLPRLLAEMRASHPDLGFTLRPPVGESPLLIDLLAGLALSEE